MCSSDLAGAIAGSRRERFRGDPGDRVVHGRCVSERSADGAGDLTLGGPPECPDRPFCVPGLKKTYGIEFAEFQPISDTAARVQALAGGQIDVALLFSTNSQIAANDFVVLEDDQGLQAAENITPVVNEEVLNDEIEELLNAVSAALTTENITELNGRVELDQEDPADVAADFLAEQGLI